MIIFLYGPDDYLREQKKKWYIKEFKKKYSGLGLGRFDLESDEGLDELKTFVRNQSIFEKKKLAALENSFNEETRSKLANLLKPLAGDKNITILLSEKKEPVKALDFLLEKPTVSQEFDYLAGYEWEKFINLEAKKLGFILDDPAVKFLADVYKGNTWGLITELEKLASVKRGGAITRRDLDGLDLEVAPNYWAMMNSLKSADVRSRLWALEKLISFGDPPPKIFNIISSQWREKLPAMAEYDLKVKSGKLDYDEALLDLAL